MLPQERQANSSAGQTSADKSVAQELADRGHKIELQCGHGTEAKPIYGVEPNAGLAFGQWPIFGLAAASRYPNAPTMPMNFEGHFFSPGAYYYGMAPL